MNLLLYNHAQHCARGTEHSTPSIANYIYYCLYRNFSQGETEENCSLYTNKMTDTEISSRGQLILYRDVLASFMKTSNSLDWRIT